MFVDKIIRFVKGYVVITAQGKFPERFLNVCANRGIYVYDVTYFSKTSVRLRMSLKAYKEVPQIAEKTFVEINEISKGGLFVLLSKYKRRKWFLFGPLILLIALFVINLFVWDIEVRGCKKVLPETIYENLEQVGVKVGAFRLSIDEKKVKNEMLLKMPELSWLWTTNRGSKIIVDVRESVPKPEIFDKSDYCNLVATKDGIIDSAVVKSGSFMFALGDTVRQNDILVSGLMLSERNIEPRKVQADGEIYARVWYEKTESFPLYEEKRTETGNVSVKRKIKLFGWEFTPFWYKNPGFSEFTTETKIFEPTVFDKYLGIKIKTDVFKEYISEQLALTEETVYQGGVNMLLEKIDEEAGTWSNRVNYTSSYVKNDDNTISVTVICEYIENIAKKVKVE